MKKAIITIFALIFAVSCAACGADKSSGESAINDMALSDIIADMYKNHSVDLSLDTNTIDISNADMLKMFTGLDSGDGIAEAAVSEPMISSQAYSLVLVRVKDAGDAAKTAETMKNGINPRKWICVEADDIATAYAGNVVMLFMVSSDFADTVTSAQMVDAFNTVAGTGK